MFFLSIRILDGRLDFSSNTNHTTTVNTDVDDEDKMKELLPNLTFSDKGIHCTVC